MGTHVQTPVVSLSLAKVTVETIVDNELKSGEP